jgi:hypothetical protein
MLAIGLSSGCSAILLERPAAFRPYPTEGLALSEFNLIGLSWGKAFKILPKQMGNRSTSGFNFLKEDVMSSSNSKGLSPSTTPFGKRKTY